MAAAPKCGCGPPSAPVVPAPQTGFAVPPGFTIKTWLKLLLTLVHDIPFTVYQWDDRLARAQRLVDAQLTIAAAWRTDAVWQLTVFSFSEWSKYWAGKQNFTLDFNGLVLRAVFDFLLGYYQYFGPGGETYG